MFMEFYCFCWKMFGYQTRYNSINDVVVFVMASVSRFLIFTSFGVDGFGSPRSMVIKHGL